RAMFGRLLTVSNATSFARMSIVASIALWKSGGTASVVRLCKAGYPWQHGANRGANAMNAPDRAGIRTAADIDMSSWWMPFTANRQFKASPRIVSGAKGMYYYTPDGREVIDASAGLWCVNAGHARQEITDAVSRQLGELDFAPGFNMGHPLAFRFASRLVEVAPAGFDKVFFT